MGISTSSWLAATSQPVSITLAVKMNCKITTCAFQQRCCVKLIQNSRPQGWAKKVEGKCEEDYGLAKIRRAMRPNKKGVGGPGGKENSLKVVIRHKIEGVAL